MHRIVAIVVAVLMGFSAPVFAQNSNASANANGQQSSESQSDGMTAMAQERDNDNTLSPLLIGGVALGVGVLVVVLATHHSHSP